jgi:hypothetical protein
MENQMENQTRTTRKTIDFTDEQVRRMDRAKEDRKVTYNELVGSAVDAYLTPQVSVPSAEQPPHQSTVESIQQRLWSLDSASQKTAERLAALEQVAEQSMECLIRIAESLAKTPAPEIAAPVPNTPSPPRSDDQAACEAMLAKIREPLVEPPPVVPEREKWWGVPPWERKKKP